MKCNRCVHYNVCLGYRNIDIDGDSNSCPYAEERPTGEWVEWIDERFGGVTFYCSECNKNALCRYEDGVFRQVKSDYCPNCGARMEAENDKDSN